MKLNKQVEIASDNACATGDGWYLGYAFYLSINNRIGPEHTYVTELGTELIDNPSPQRLFNWVLDGVAGQRASEKKKAIPRDRFLAASVVRICMNDAHGRIIGLPPAARAVQETVAGMYLAADGASPVPAIRYEPGRDNYLFGKVTLGQTGHPISDRAIMLPAADPATGADGTLRAVLLGHYPERHIYGIITDGMHFAAQCVITQEMLDGPEARVAIE